jgi:hypothetical protein
MPITNDELKQYYIEHYNLPTENITDEDGNVDLSGIDISVYATSSTDNSHHHRNYFSDATSPIWSKKIGNKRVVVMINEHTFNDPDGVYEIISDEVGESE